MLKSSFASFRVDLTRLLVNEGSCCLVGIDNNLKTVININFFEKVNRQRMSYLGSAARHV